MFNIDSLIKRLKFRYPLFTVTIEHLEFLEDYTMPTAATDGNVVLYNPNFMNKLNVHQQLFVLAHEISHVALNHIPRLKNREMSLWNIATDAVINAFLVKDGLEPVEGMIFLENALDFSSEELYNHLKEAEDYIQNNVSGDPSMTDNQHSKWGNSSNSNDDNADGDDSSNNNSKEKGNSKEKDSSLNQETDDNSSIDERKVFEDNSKTRAENEKKLKDELSKGSKCFSINQPGFDSPEIKITDVGRDKALIDWRRLLKEACNLELDYSYKDAQIEDGVLVSRLIEIPSCETEILLDTSGSINNSLLKAFLRECKNILQNSKIRVACFDDKVYDFVDIRSEYELENMKFKGGGGTNFNAACKGFSNRVDNKIIFTDGYGSVKNPPLDIIWVVFESISAFPKECKVIKVDKNKLLKK